MLLYHQFYLFTITRGNGLKPADKIVKLNTWIKQYCEKKGFIYLDYFTPMADERNGMKASLTIDGVHTNVAGYKIMEPLAESAIQTALNHNSSK